MLFGNYRLEHQIWTDLIDRGSREGLDTECVETLTRPPFLVDEESFRTHLEKTLLPLLD